MTDPYIHVGDLLGHDHYDCPAHDVFVGGYFDHQYDGPFRVEARGADWIVVRGQGGRVHTYTGDLSNLAHYKDITCPTS